MFFRVRLAALIRFRFGTFRDMLFPMDNFVDRKFSALLFDMDGTILNSIAVAEKIWGDWAAGFGIDVESFLPTIHGIRSVENIAKLNLPGVDAESEAQKITNAEISEVDGVVPIPGAEEFLKSLPKNKWAVVTSAPRKLALARLVAVGFPLPSVLVAAEDVKRGKPDPECYILAAKQLGVDPRDCLVFEDAEAGIQAGQASGAQVVVVTSTHRSVLKTDHFSIKDYVDHHESLLGKII